MQQLKNSKFICAWGWSPKLYSEHPDAYFVVSEEPKERGDASFFVMDSPLQMAGVARKIAWMAVLKNLEIILIDEGGEAFQKELEMCHLAAGLILSESSDFWVTALQNAKAHQGAFRRGMALQGAFQGVPAIIVGAGPSLEKNRHLLKEFQNKALLFAAGSAINVIGAEPHFAASVDVDAPHDQFASHPFRKVPFCFQGRMSPKNLSLMEGEKIFFPDSSLPIVNWIYGENSMNGGWTVGNFTAQIASLLGCDPLIFVGMDFCYREDQKYTDIKVEIPKERTFLNGVWTQKDWIMGAMWIEEMKGKTLINATEGGILNLERKTLSECLPLCLKEWDLKSWVQNEIQKLPFLEEGKWKEWEESLARSRGKIDEEEIAFRFLLEPLWKIWRPVFEREIPKHHDLELHKKLFFEQIVEEHEKYLSD